MFPSLVLLPPLIAIPVVGIVYADTRQRRLPWQTRLSWSASAGLVSLGEFLLVFTFDSLLSRAYFLVLDDPIVVHSPRELLTGPRIAGVAVSAMTVFTYGIASRYGPLYTP